MPRGSRAHAGPYNFHIYCVRLSDIAVTSAPAYQRLAIIYWGGITYAVLIRLEEGCFVLDSSHGIRQNQHPYMQTSCALKKWLFLAIATPLFLNCLPAEADVWTDCMFPDSFAPGPYYFGPNDNEFKRTGYPGGVSGPLYWAGFALNGGFIDSNPASVYKNGDVWGDIGAAGTGNISLEDGFRVHKVAGRGGNVYYHTGGKYSKTAGATVEGAVVSNGTGDNILERGANFALGASEYAFNLAATPVFVNGSMTATMPTTVNLKNQNMSVSLTNSCNVLKLQDFVIQGGTFTLMGNFTTQSVIINVNRDFVMNGGAKIVLSGGLEWDEVLFNIHGKGNVVSFDQNANLTGIVLAPKRHVRLKGGTIINGLVIGEEIELASLSQIRHPSVVSPIGP